MRQFNAVGDVRDDDFRAFDVGKVVVRTIGSVLVFSEIHRIVDLPDIVIQGSRARQERVSTDFVKHFLAEIGYLYGMLERARRSGGQLPQQRAVGVAQLHKRQGSGEAENALKHGDDRLGQQHEKRIQGEHYHARPADFSPRKEGKGKIHSQIANKNKEGRLDETMVHPRVRYAESG